jgi:hypothetical protein
LASRRGGRPERLEALIREGEALGLDEATDMIRTSETLN